MFGKLKIFKISQLLKISKKGQFKNFKKYKISKKHSPWYFYLLNLLKELIFLFLGYIFTISSRLKIQYNLIQSDQINKILWIHHKIWSSVFHEDSLVLPYVMRESQGVKGERAACTWTRKYGTLRPGLPVRQVLGKECKIQLCHAKRMPNNLSELIVYTRARARTHTHTHTHIYIYIYICDK
jgi:hypothetical protein